MSVLPVGFGRRGALIFSFGYMGSDLPNPFSFVNMHYFFLWLPVAFGLSWRPGETSAPPGLSGDIHPAAG